MIVVLKCNTWHGSIARLCFLFPLPNGLASRLITQGSTADVTVSAKLAKEKVTRVPRSIQATLVLSDKLGAFVVLLNHTRMVLDDVARVDRHSFHVAKSRIRIHLKVIPNSGESFVSRTWT